MAKFLQVDNQETVILIDRTSNTAKVYSSDTRYRNRFRKLYSDKQVKTYQQDGEVIAEEYEIDKRLITFRSAVPKRRQLTEQERAELRARLEKARESKAV
jgi:hypothetical protein